MALGKKILYLTDLWVHPSARGNGVGPELLKRALKLAVTHDAARIIADVTTVQAVKACQKVFGQDAVNVLISPPEITSQDADSIMPAVARLEYQVENHPSPNLAAAPELGM